MSGRVFARRRSKLMRGAGVLGGVSVLLLLGPQQTAEAISFNNAGASPVEGSIDLVIALASTLSLDIVGHPTNVPATALSGTPANDVSFGSVAIAGGGGCTAAPATGACFGVAAVTPNQVNLVGTLQATVNCSGFATFGLYVYRATPVTGLLTGRARFKTGTAATTAPATVPGGTWTADADGTAIQETAAATVNASLTSALIASGATCQTTFVAYQLAGRVLSTDTTGTTTPVTHRLFAL